ncbi:TMF family protein [Spirosoma sp. BT702]|uniref:TMF family protein n=1 Tax=Spirosoma profusum TaxID=2771354 RepID=A0A926XXI4_9BACT|nr:TMF family protein [Spirosoma profusum]
MSGQTIRFGGNRILHTSSNASLYIGFQAGNSIANSGVSHNTFVGFSAGGSNTTGVFNAFFGANAGYLNTASFNTFLGSLAGEGNTSGPDNVYVGYQAGYYNKTGGYNVFLGKTAGLQNTEGSKNTFLGYQAGYSNTTASANVFIGYQTGYNNTSGIGNLFMGQLAGYSSNGSYNLFIGNSSGQQTTSGGGNTFIGNGSGYGNTTGQNNTYIGNGAGFTGNGAGQSNTFIGQNAGVSPGAVVNNSTAIGVAAQVSADNSIILGVPNPLWKVGIGNTAPANKLEITHGTAGQSGLRFTNLKSSNTASATNQTKVLSVNENGDVILVSTNGSTREGVSETLWQRKGSFLQSTQNDAVIIGTNVARTPAGYKLFVEQGILTEKVKVAVKNTSDWSDYVFKAGYSLKPLAEVEQYIQKHEHLPGIPSAKEVVEKGVDVARMDAKLLEKIEELTLYSIQLEKEVQSEKAKHQQEVKSLKDEMTELKALMKQVLEKK